MSQQTPHTQPNILLTATYFSEKGKSFTNNDLVPYIHSPTFSLMHRPMHTDVHLKYIYTHSCTAVDSLYNSVLHCLSLLSPLTAQPLMDSSDAGKMMKLHTILWRSTHYPETPRHTNSLTLITNIPEFQYMFSMEVC